MNLKPKKKLAVKVLGVGAERIKFNSERINEIKEAITRQDIKELVKRGNRDNFCKRKKKNSQKNNKKKGWKSKEKD